MTGLAREQLTGLDLRGLRDQSFTPALAAALRGDDSAYRGPYTSTRGTLDGIVSLHTQPVIDADGTVVGGIAVLTRLADGAVDGAQLPVAG